MNNHLIELCPICIDNSAEYYTECGHKYCIECLCRIKKCALCRKQLLKANLCIEIKKQNKDIQKYDFLGISNTVRTIILLEFNMSQMRGLAGGSN
jgi:hypothetical protein